MSIAPVEAERPGHITAALGGAQLFLRRLRLEPGPLLTMLALLAFSCFLFAALPRLFNDIADDGLRYMVEEATVDARNVRMLRTGRTDVGPASRPLGSVAERTDRARDELPPALRNAVVESTFVVRSPRYIFQPDAVVTVPQGAITPGAQRGLIRYLTLRAQPDVGTHVRIVAGRFPRPSREHARPEVRQPIFTTPSPFRPRGVEFVSWARRVPVLEIALSAPAARELRLRVGDRAVYLPDRMGDFAFRGVAVRDARPLAVKLVGVFETRNLREPYWFGEESVQTPNVQSTQDVGTTRVYAHALTSPGAYSEFLEATSSVPLTYEHRHYIEADRLDAGQLGQLNRAVAELETRYAAAGPLDPKVETSLGDIFQRYSTARSQAETLLAVAAIGLLACALANIGLLGVLWYSRRRNETRVARARGASSRQVFAAQVAEGLLIAVPAGLLGWVAAVLVVDARPSSLSAWLAFGLVASTVALLVLSVAGTARRPLGPDERDDVVFSRPSPRRLALEAAVVVAAAGGVYLLRRRGLESSAEEGFDPYLAAVPVLLGLACAIVALRLYPLPILALSRLARRSRGLAVHLGLNRAARQPDISSAPLLVLVLALAIACFAAAMVATLDSGQNRSAWRALGADARVDADLTDLGAALPAKLVSRLDEEGEIARAYVQDVEAGEPGQETPMIAVELEAFERIVRGTPAEVRFPSELHNPAIPGLVPAVVSTNWPATGTFPITLPRVTVNTLVVGNRDSFPGVPADTPFAIVPYSALKETEAEGEIVRPNRLYIGGVGSAAVRAAVEDSGARVDVETRVDAVDRLRESPLIENVLRGFRAAIVLAALYAAFAVGLMGLIAARSRARDLALVRTMGASPRDGFVLAAVEVAPLVLTALALGIALGIAIPYLIEPGLDLAFFTGSGSAPIVIPWPTLAVAAVGLLVLVAATVVVVGFQARRADLGGVLRIGER
ncbi:MAG: FtsX-like permease family protein [Gaiellaceae bacterium]